VLDLGTAVQRALVDPAALGGNVLLFDLSGDYLAIGLADLLASNDVEVEIVTNQTVVGQYVLASLDGVFIYPRLASAGVRFTPQHTVERIDAGSVEIASIWGGKTSTREGVDSIVLSLLRAPQDAIAAELSDLGIAVTSIGDALAPRRTADAIFEGEKVGRELFADF
jgi:hypothetical protein